MGFGVGLVGGEASHVLGGAGADREPVMVVRDITGRGHGGDPPVPDLRYVLEDRHFCLRKENEPTL